MTGWTLKHEEIGLALVPPQYREKVKKEFALSDKKSGGYITVQVSQPKKVGTLKGVSIRTVEAWVLKGKLKPVLTFMKRNYFNVEDV